MPKLEKIIGLCHLCGQEKKLIDAHIIPKSFYKPLFDPKNGPLQLVGKNESPKRAPIGLYDKSILCKDCDSLLGKYDDYAQKFFKSHPTWSFKSGISHLGPFEKGLLGYYKADNYDYSTLKLFFISLIWRASISSHNVFQNVQLGTVSNKAREMLLNYNPGKWHEFNVACFKLQGGIDNLEYIITNFGKVENQNIYTFQALGFCFHVGIDKESVIPGGELVCLSPIPPWYIICKDYYKSRQLQNIINLCLT
jgi:hypothetical protein